MTVFKIYELLVSLQSASSRNYLLIFTVTVAHYSCEDLIALEFASACSSLNGMTDRAECNACGCEETVEHLLCHCPSFENERLALHTVLYQLDIRPCSLNKILGQWPLI